VAYRPDGLRAYDGGVRTETRIPVGNITVRPQHLGVARAVGPDEMIECLRLESGAVRPLRGGEQIANRLAGGARKRGPGRAARCGPQTELHDDAVDGALGNEARCRELPALQRERLGHAIGRVVDDQWTAQKP